ncbi:MAG: OmpA family protein [Pelistega sp.]|nr:OmpA family protein [Pelistega sp.]
MAALTLAACGNLSKVSSEGMTEDPIWPDPTQVGMNNGKGTFPDRDALKEVEAGMTKDQLYYLIGRPHFREGIWGVREWDYLFHFHTPGQGTNNVTTCQFKVLYDKNLFTQSFFWKPVDPVDGVCPPGAGPQRYTIAADALFAFNRSDLNSMNAQGRARLDELASTIKGFDQLKGVTVYGHTDRLGDDRYNQGLSQRRAETVRQYLVQSGVPAQLISAQGMGESQPVVQCDNANRTELIRCLAPNRRVEVSVDGSGQLK